MTNPEKTKLTMQPPRGTRDVLPGESEQWQKLEDLARKTLKSAGYKEIRLPVFEQTELFCRTAGEGSDVVNKEMYTFADKADRSLTLRPEGTAQAARAYLNASMDRRRPPTKLFYMGQFFRNEAVQTGRYRQFNQLGLEAFGSASPLLDAETIAIACDFLRKAGVAEFEVQINSLGCSTCRPVYREALKEKLRDRLSTLCKDCCDRYERNPLRMLDCKVEADQEQFIDVPGPLGYLCADCESQWEALTLSLGQLKVPFAVNRRLVRGLDYYTRTVFEIVSQDRRLGAQSTIAAGGRYDNLIESLGGPPTPAVGLAVGWERLLLLLEAPPATNVDVFVVSTDVAVALQVATSLRQAGISTDLEFPAAGTKSRSFTKQLQEANKLGCRWAVIIGENELVNNEVTLKDMRIQGLQISVPLADLPRKLKGLT